MLIGSSVVLPVETVELNLIFHQENTQSIKGNFWRVFGEHFAIQSKFLTIYKLPKCQKTNNCLPAKNTIFFHEKRSLTINHDLPLKKADLGPGRIASERLINKQRIN